MAANVCSTLQMHAPLLPLATATLRSPSSNGAHFPLLHVFLPGLSLSALRTLNHLPRGRTVRRRFLHRAACPVVAQKTDLYGTDQISAQQFFESFLRERQARSDFVSKTSDLLWRREIFEADEESLDQVRERLAELQKIREDDSGSGLLKLSQARRWSVGVDEAPTNAKPSASDIERLQEDRRRASFLEYEALKRELSLLTGVVAAFCSFYCAVLLSSEACLSYSIGAVGSLLYLKLLFYHADEISEDNVAEIFLRRRRKTIGIRSTDVQDSFEKTFYGTSLALSSPRLVIPASLFGLWRIAQQSTDMHINLQLAPLMLGFFAYKGALLIQAYRDNKDLITTFPKEEAES